jgi:hypothetical protein
MWLAVGAEVDLVRDVPVAASLFSGWLYGQRSARTSRLLAVVRAELGVA